MNYKNRAFFIFFGIVFYFIFAVPLQAMDVSSEIININQEQRIVFVDLGNDVLSVGDIMSVEGLEHPVYLEVIQVSDAVSKLRVSKVKKFFSNASELDSLTIGMKVTRILAIQEPRHSPAIEPPVVAVAAETAAPQAVSSNNLPGLDSQAFVKPDISKESIQSIVDRMNTMADANVKLSSALAQCQAAEGDSEKLCANNEDLKKQVEESNSRLVEVAQDRDKYKKQAVDLLAKINDLKSRLDRLGSLIGEH